MTGTIIEYSGDRSDDTLELIPIGYWLRFQCPNLYCDLNPEDVRMLIKDLQEWVNKYELEEWDKEINSEKEEIYVLDPSGCYTNQLNLDL